MNEAELRQQNRALISKLIEGQKAVQRSTYDATKLSREFDLLQNRLDSLHVRERDDLGAAKVSASRSNNSTITGDGNMNNNNISNTRWSSRNLGKESYVNRSRLQSSDLSVLSDRALSPRRPKIYTLDNTLDSDVGVLSPPQSRLYPLENSPTLPNPRQLKHLQEDFPVRPSPREVRPYLPRNSPTQPHSCRALRDSPTHSHLRQALRDSPTQPHSRQALRDSPNHPRPRQALRDSPTQPHSRQALRDSPTHLRLQQALRDSSTQSSPRQSWLPLRADSPAQPSPCRPMVYTLGESPDLDEDDVMVVKGSLNENKTVRRKLAEEMGCSPHTSPPTKDYLSEDSQALPIRSPLKDATNSHTPRQGNRASAFETPKSILKHRKLIDSNVEVDSRFAHTPGWMERAKHTRLRPPRDAGSTKSGKNQKKSVKARKLPSSDKTEIGDLRGVSFLSDAHASEFTAGGDPSVLKSEVGNLRSRSSPSCQISTIPSEMSPPSVHQGELSVDMATPDRNTMPTPTSLSKVGPSPDISSVSASVSRQRMMGYDWIAALLDQSDMSEVTDKHESYFRELREFRRLNRDECQNEAVSQPGGNAHLSYIDTDDITLAVPEATSPNHTCIHSYTVNPRLYTVPVNGDRTGASRCAVCNKKKHLPSTSSPGFVRISIPRSTLSSPYRVKPHRRKSFDPSDSVALSKHCLAGWVHQHPMKLPLGRNVDLANETKRLKSRFMMTMAEAEDLARKTKMSIPPDSRDLDRTTLYNREVKKITNQLLDMSHAMQFQTQLHNKTPIH